MEGQFLIAIPPSRPAIFFICSVDLCCKFTTLYVGEPSSVKTPLA